jgi:hypothetical protein
MPHFGAVTSQRPYSGRNAGFIRRALHPARREMAYPQLDPTESRLIQPNPTSFSKLLIPEASGSGQKSKNDQMTQKASKTCASPASREHLEPPPLPHLSPNGESARPRVHRSAPRRPKQACGPWLIPGPCPTPFGSRRSTLDHRPVLCSSRLLATIATIATFLHQFGPDCNSCNISPYFPQTIFFMILQLCPLPFALCASPYALCPFGRPLTMPNRPKITHHPRFAPVPITFHVSHLTSPIRVIRAPLSVVCGPKSALALITPIYTY